MYERFTDRARKVMQLANQEALRFHHEYVGTEHILLGLIREGSGVGANVLKNFDVDLRAVLLEVEKIIQPGPQPVAKGKRLRTPRARKAIECALEEARDLNHDHVGTGHILLGLLREEEGVAAQVLMNLGVTLQQTRQDVRLLPGEEAVGGRQEKLAKRRFAKVALVQIVYAAAMAGILGLLADSWLVLLVAFLIVLTSANLPTIVKHFLSYQR